MEELKPCPNCGSMDFIMECQGKKCYLECLFCDTQGPKTYGIDKAIQEWNNLPRQDNVHITETSNKQKSEVGLNFSYILNSNGNSEKKDITNPVPTWDNYFLTMARHAATRSTCLRRKVGAVAVLDRHVLATGYNGAPSGLKHCEFTGCLREQKGVPSGERHEICRGLHAEQNVIIQAAVHGVSLKGATIYVTATPCVICAKMLINCGIKRVVCGEQYPDGMALEMLRDAGVVVEVIDK